MMHLNHPQTISHPGLWKNGLPRNQLLVPLGTTGLNKRNVSSPGLGVQKVKVMVSAGLIPSEDGEGESFMPPSFWWVPAVFSIHGLVGASP